MTTTNKYRGVVVPMVTPVKENMFIDEEAVSKIIKSFDASSVSPLLMGTTGEGNSVSHDAAVTLVKAAAQAATDRIVIYAGLTGNCFQEQVDQALAFARAGANVIVATLPTYYALTPDQMYNYYIKLADAVTKPLMLYNILATTHMSIPVDVVKALADHPNIVGLKDSERDLDRMRECIAFSSSRPDFSFFCGWAAQSCGSLRMGADGIVPSTGNFVPEMFARLYEAATSGDWQQAEALQEATDKIAKIYQAGRTLGQSLAALKVMMGTRGLCGPDMLMPLTRLTAEEEAEIVNEVINYNGNG